MENNKLKIKEFILRNMSDYDLKDDENIFQTGFIDSLFAMQLVLFLEKEFALVIENTDLDINNFKSIDSIVEFLNKRL